MCLPKTYSTCKYASEMLLRDLTDDMPPQVAFNFGVPALESIAGNLPFRFQAKGLTCYKKGQKAKLQKCLR